MKTHRIALSTCGLEPSKDDFLAMARAGIEALEVSPSHDHSYDFPYYELKSAADAAGIRLWSYHLPFCGAEKHNIANPNHLERREAVRRHKSRMEIAALMGIHHAVIHPCWEPTTPNEPHARSICLEAAKDSLAEMAGIAQDLDMVLCVEDLPRTCLGNRSSEILELLSADPRLRCCFDTNHLLGEPIADFIRAVGPKIATVHMSDYDFTNERHWLPGEGRIDWVELLDGLDAAGYDGPILFEVPPHGSPNSIERPRDLVWEDYARCARELMARTPLTAIAKGKENLPMWP